MNYELKNNKVTIAGQIVSEPKFSHEMFGEGFYEFDLKVMRLSNTFDIIPITISERLLNEYNLKIDNFMCGSGQFRSYNKMEENKSRLMLTVFIREILDYNANENPNYIEITGYICKEPVFRVTPFKREIADILLAVNRSYNKSDYLPCIAWGRNARFLKNFKIGNKVKAVGRIQSRTYQKKLDEENVVSKVAFEVSLSKIFAFNDENIEIYEEDLQQNLYSQ